MVNSFFIVSKWTSFVLVAISTALGFGDEGTSAILKLTAMAFAGRLILVLVPVELKTVRHTNFSTITEEQIAGISWQFL